MRLIRGLRKSENEVLALLCKGLTNKQIAKVRGCSYYTVKNIVHDIYVKIRAKNRVHAMWLVQEGKAVVHEEPSYRHRVVKHESRVLPRRKRRVAVASEGR